MSWVNTEVSCGGNTTASWVNTAVSICRNTIMSLVVWILQCLGREYYSVFGREYSSFWGRDYYSVFRHEYCCVLGILRYLGAGILQCLGAGEGRRKALTQVDAPALPSVARPTSTALCCSPVHQVAQYGTNPMNPPLLKCTQKISWWMKELWHVVIKWPLMVG